MLSFLLVPLYTEVMPASGYGSLTIIFTFFALFNVILAYGMETAFFRFYNNEQRPGEVLSTAQITLLLSTGIFVLLGVGFRAYLSQTLNIEPTYFGYFLGILALDALAIVPFANLRATEQPGKYTLIKLANVGINIVLNLYLLLWLPKTPIRIGMQGVSHGDQIQFILLAMLVSSGVTLCLLSKSYINVPWKFNLKLAFRMLRYGFPVMIAGIAFTVNEVFDKYLLSELLPLSPDAARAEVGKYAACYKLAMFMTLFGTAFRLGIEPFFFAHAKSANPQQAYAQITQYFVVLGSVILLGVVVFSDLIKGIIIRDSVFWEAMEVVPIILTASLFLGIYHNLSVWYKITDRTRFGAIISLVGAALTIAINVAYIPSYGYMASAWATLAAYGTMMVLSYVLGKRYYPIPYNMRRLGLYLGVSIGFSALYFYTFKSNLYIGIGFLTLFLGIIYKQEWVQLKQIIQKS